VGPGGHGNSRNHRKFRGILSLSTVTIRRLHHCTTARPATLSFPLTAKRACANNAEPAFRQETTRSMSSKTEIVDPSGNDPQLQWGAVKLIGLGFVTLGFALVLILVAANAIGE
jgi:hypothetical protein